MHVDGFSAGFQAHPDAEIVGVWDDDQSRGKSFCEERHLTFIDSLDSLLTECDAAIIFSENLKHADHLEAALSADKHVLCEKPIAAHPDHLTRIQKAAQASNRVQATAFPCPHSPNFKSALSKVENGDIGIALAVCATNQGTCPWGWFVEKSLSGGGAMIDHVVHVADLLRRLLDANPVSVQAQTGNNMYGMSWEDTAMVTVNFASGAFATIDSSWSKPSDYHTWGNVCMNIVGEKGVIEVDLFAQGVQLYSGSGMKHRPSGSNLDQLLVDDFLSAISGSRKPLATLDDGLWASRVALAAYQSVASGGELASV